MKGVVFAAIAAAIGNFLQGWDNATIAGSMVYIIKEMNLSTSMQGFVVVLSLIGGTLITLCSGPISDLLGRRVMLIISSILYFISGLVMLWSPNVYILCLARLLNGFGSGLAVTLVPVYISETAPPNIRGQLNTLPVLTDFSGLLLAYCMVFMMSLQDSPSWREMLGVLWVPSLLYMFLMMFYLPESPRWLVSKGRLEEAKRVLQRLLGKEDVTDEMNLLVDGLQIRSGNIGDDLSVDDHDVDGTSYMSPILCVRHESQESLKDPIVDIFESLHEKLTESSGSLQSAFSHSFESLSSTLDSPLITHHATTMEGEDDIDNGDNNTSDLPLWSTLLEPGVKRALIVGIGVQLLQQLSGINGLLYYTPEILKEAGVDSLLSQFKLSSISASFLIIAVITLIMHPSIFIAMKLMDKSGRRTLLLWTIPVLIISLLVLVFSELVHINKVINATLSTTGLVIYLCFFVMGYGPIPNILCSEIFPTRVRGLCITICALAYWTGNIIITYSFPVLLNSVGMTGIFSIYATMCIVSWIFVYLKVPETKGMSLEVIIEFFKFGAQQAEAPKEFVNVIHEN